MNVLILTPDAVGSTLLQRLLTIYMQFHNFDQPVINLHELTNGLDKFFSPEFNRELITRQGKWGYHQSLKEVVDLLDSVDHYKTARLAQYHIVQRGDPLSDQLPFYQYLNDNFYIIACLRENLFEHAVSHAFNAVTKKLNVYTPEEKIDNFYGLYRSGLEIQPEVLYSALDRYRDYLDWARRHFTVGSYFSYETHLKDIEKYILSLPVFGAQNKRITWHQVFDQEFEDWNRCHYYNSDLGSIALSAPSGALQIENQSTQNKNAVQIVQDLLPAAHKSFLDQHGQHYAQASDAIAKMRALGILPSTVPIKKQTLSEKLFMVKNLDQCVDAFNHWADHNPEVASKIDITSLQHSAAVEYKKLWNPTAIAADSPTPQISSGT